MSVDNYIPMPLSPGGYNRYNYANSNPLKYIDPDGEFWHIVIGAVIGGVANLISNAIQGKIENFGDGVKSFGIGALAGAIGAGVGAGVSTAIAGGSFGAGFMGTTSVASTGFFAGAASGAAGGGSSGFVLGMGNSLIQGDNFASSLKQGFGYGTFGAITGGIAGGITGGIDALSKKTSFFTGTAKVDLSKGYGAHNIPQEISNSNTVKVRSVGKFEGVRIYESSKLGTGSGSGGITLPGFGIIVGKGAYTQMRTYGTWNLIAHEFGHVLQSRIPKVGADGFYNIIGTESLSSATFNPSGHSSFWTETWANYLSNNYFSSGQPWDIKNYPIQNISAFNLLKFTLYRAIFRIPIPAIYP